MQFFSLYFFAAGRSEKHGLLSVLPPGGPDCKIFGRFCLRENTSYTCETGVDLASSVVGKGGGFHGVSLD